MIGHRWQAVLQEEQRNVWVRLYGPGKRAVGFVGGPAALELDQRPFVQEDRRGVACVLVQQFGCGLVAILRDKPSDQVVAESLVVVWVESQHVLVAVGGWPKLGKRDACRYVAATVPVAVGGWPKLGKRDACRYVSDQKGRERLWANSGDALALQRQCSRRRQAHVSIHNKEF